MNGTPKERISKARKFAWEVALQVSVWAIIGTIATSIYWIPIVYGTVTAVGKNSMTGETNRTAIAELAVIVGDMGVLYGNAEILDVGDTLTAQVNFHSDARRYSEPGTRLVLTNTGDGRKMSATVEVDGKFEGEPHIFLNLSRAAGRRVGASPGDLIQVMIVAEK